MVTSNYEQRRHIDSVPITPMATIEDRRLVWVVMLLCICCARLLHPVLGCDLPSPTWCQEVGSVRKSVHCDSDDEILDLACARLDGTLMAIRSSSSCRLQTSTNRDICPAAFGCPRPYESWCNHTGAIFSQLDCDGDGLLDVVCFDANGNRWASLSSRNCTVDLQASSDTCPAAFGCRRPSPTWCTGTSDVLKQTDCDGDGILDLACYSRDSATRRVLRSTKLCLEVYDAPVESCPSAFVCDTFAGYTTLADKDHVGSNLDGNIYTLEKAAAICTAEPSCLGFNSNGVLKTNSTPDASITINSCLYAKVVAPSSCPQYVGYRLMQDKAHPNDTIRAFDPDAPISCSKDRRCRGFTGDGETKSSVENTVTSWGSCLYKKILEEPTGCTYLVASGDTLLGIASLSGTTVATLKMLNPAVVKTPSLLKKGLLLSVPCDGSCTTECCYVFKKGDSLSSIAKANMTNVETLLSLNPGLVQGNLQAGQFINVPCMTSETNNTQGECPPASGYNAMANTNHIPNRDKIGSFGAAAVQQCSVDRNCQGFNSYGETWQSANSSDLIQQNGTCFYTKSAYRDTSVLLDLWQQCGGMKASANGYCGNQGGPLCTDSPWPTVACAAGSICKKVSAWWWHCERTVDPTVPMIPPIPITECNLPATWSDLYVATPDVDHQGYRGRDDISNYTTIEQAANECMMDPTCLAFNSLRVTKRSSSPDVQAKGVCLYTKRAPVCKEYLGYNPMLNMAHAGGGLSSRSFGDSAASQCAADPDCKGFNSQGFLITSNLQPMDSNGTCLYSKSATGTYLLGYTFYPYKDFDLSQISFSSWLRGDSNYVDIEKDISNNTILYKELCDLDVTCSGFTTDGVLKRGPIQSADLEYSARFTISSEGIYLKNDKVYVLPYPREPMDREDCLILRQNSSDGSQCYVDVLRFDQFLTFEILKKTGATNIYQIILDNPHVPYLWSKDHYYEWQEFIDTYGAVKDSVNICICPGPGIEASRWNRSRPIDLACLADIAGGQGGIARACSGFQSDYAKARCFCLIQQDATQRAYVWPFKDVNTPYDCNTFIECKDFRPVVHNKKFRRHCDQNLDQDEPNACPGCMAIDPLFGDEGNGVTKPICRFRQPITGTNPIGAALQCTEREPGNLCHWWMLPGGMYQDPYDESGALVLRCPDSSIKAVYEGSALYSHLSSAFCNETEMIFDNVKQACVPKPATWTTIRQRCPARRLTVADGQGYILSQCVSIFMGALNYTANSSKRRSLDTDGPPLGVSFDDVAPAGIGSATVFKPIQYVSACVRNDAGWQGCCDGLVDKAAKSGCFPMRWKSYKQADMCDSDSRQCGMSKGNNICRCFYAAAAAGNIQVGKDPKSCPTSAYQNCKAIFSGR